MENRCLGYGWSDRFLSSTFVFGKLNVLWKSSQNWSSSLAQKCPLCWRNYSCLSSPITAGNWRGGNYRSFWQPRTFLHLWAGLFVVGLTCLSAWSANQINSHNSWARSLHISVNGILFVGLAYVSWTGWDVVQKYL